MLIVEYQTFAWGSRIVGVVLVWDSYRRVLFVLPRSVAQLVVVEQVIFKCREETVTWLTQISFVSILPMVLSPVYRG